MNCEEIQAQLSDYLDHNLSGTAISIIEQHLSSCTICREEAEWLSEGIGHVAALPIVEPPLGFTSRVMSHLAEIEARPGLWRKFLVPLQARISMQAATVVLIGILGIYLFQREKLYEQPKPPAERAPAVVAKQENAGAGPSETLSSAQTASSSIARTQGAGAAGGQRQKSTTQAAPPTGRAFAPIVATPVTNQDSSPMSGGPVTFSFPFETDTAPALRSMPSAIEPFADYELIVRRHHQTSMEPRDLSGREHSSREAVESGVEGAWPARAIDRLLAAIPDHARPQTIWIVVPKNQYGHFKSELHALGTIESETRVPLLRDQPESQGDGQIRVKLTAMPADSKATDHTANR